MISQEKKQTNFLLKQEQIGALEIYNQQKYSKGCSLRNRQNLINSIKRQSTLKLSTQISQHKASIQFDRILGGGQCCSSREVIMDDRLINTKLGNITSLNIQNHKLEKGFQKNYNALVADISHRINILKETDEESEIEIIVKKCLNKYKELIPTNNSAYRSYVLQLFDIILQYMISGAQHIGSYEKIVNQMQIFTDSMKLYKQQHSCQDFIFFSELLSNLNEQTFDVDQTNQQKLKSCSKFVTILIENGVSNHYQQMNNLSHIIEEESDLLETIKKDAFNKKEKQESVWEVVDIIREKVFLQKDHFFSQITGLWVLRIEKFGKFQLVQSIENEILFYIDQFIDFIESPDRQTSSQLILYILLQINSLLEQGNENNLGNKDSSILAINTKNVKKFLMILQQKEIKTDNLQQFFSFSLKDTTYRFLSKQILLNYYKLSCTFKVDLEEKEQQWIPLVYSYITEEIQQVKVLFQSNSYFIKEINNGDNSQIAKKVIDYQIVRKKQFQTFMSTKDFEQYESTIHDEEDFLNKISLNLIERWELEARQRLDKDIALKDDILLEVQDLYIQQNLTFMQGNNIFTQSQMQQNINDDKSNMKKNAIELIIENFLIPNSSKQDQKDTCKILGILAEGGTGKSMLVKKLETTLMKDKDLILKKYQNQVNYIPFLIKCNNLDHNNPSIENYLMSQKLDEKQIDQLKNISKFKIILLDGYDEYTGDYFRVYSKLKLKEWKNTLIIITSRLEKLTLSDACAYFSQDNEIGQRDEKSYCIVQLKEFQRKDIDEYCIKFFNKPSQSQPSDETSEHYIEIMKQCLNNKQLELLLFLPINLYLFTRMIKTNKELDLQYLTKNISDQIQIQEIFFKEQFNREAVEFISSQKLPSSANEKDKQLKEYISTQYFVYFQTISMKMFLNKGIKSNFLQLDRDKINFKLQQSTQISLSQENQEQLCDKISNYVNSKIIMRVKENEDSQGIKENKIIEFKHKSLFEYFVARAMKFDFDIHGKDIINLDISQLQKFNINQKPIMNKGKNQSEQQILLKLYKLIQHQIDGREFKGSYYQNDIKKNHIFIQYLKRSTINKVTDVSPIDVGSSNLLSALFISKFLYPHLSFTKCSFSKAYIPHCKSSTISFDQCNFNDSNLKNANLSSFETSFTQYACIDSYQKEFDTNNFYSSNGIAFYQNTLVSITSNGIINSYKITDQGYQLLLSKQITCQSLITINIIDSKILISSPYSVFEINPITLEIDQSFKFFSQIKGISVHDNQQIIELRNSNIYFGNILNGFKHLQIQGNNPILSKKYIVTQNESSMFVYDVQSNFSLIKQLPCKFQQGKFNKAGNKLVTVNHNTFQIWDVEKDFKLINTIEGHNDTINSITFSRDEKYFATGSRDQTCKIWNVVQDFQLINTIQGHTDTINSIAFSVDGKYLSTSSDNQICKIWNVEKGFQLIDSIQGHTSSINSVAFSADGKYLATGSEDRTSKIWNVEKGLELINTIQGHTGNVNSVAFSADGKYLATGSSDKTCKIWSVEKNYELINTLQGHTDSINSVAFSADGQYLATGSSDQTCKIWKVEKGFELIYTIQDHIDSINQITFSADGKYLATASKDSTCKIWNVEKGFQLFNTINGHISFITSVAFSADGKYLATGSWDKTCKIWNVEKDFELVNTIQGHTYFVNSVAFSADGKYLSTGSSDKTCKIWNIEKGFELVNTIEVHFDSVKSTPFSADGKYLATGSWDKTCKIWSVEKGFEFINTIKGHTNSICSVALSSDGKYLATGSRDLTCKIWSVEKGFELVNTIEGHTNYINSVAFSADGKYLATGSSDQTCKIWNVQKGFELMNTIQGSIDSIGSVAFSADGKYLATGAKDGTCCKVWNILKDFQLTNTIEGYSNSINSVAFSVDGKYLSTGSKIWNAEKDFELINTIEGHTNCINQVAFSANGKYLATASWDQTCKIWNIQKGFELTNTFQGHTDSISSVAFSPDGKYLATGSYQICKIWNVEKGFELINTIHGHEHFISSIAFSVDGKYLTTGSIEGTCKIWNVEKGLELINSIQGNIDSISQVAYSADGKYLATSIEGKTCKIWNVEKGFELINTIQYHSADIILVAFSPDGKYLATVQKDETYKIWNVEKDFELVNEDKGYQNLIKRFNFSDNQFNKIKNEESQNNLRIYNNNLLKLNEQSLFDQIYQM